MAGKSERTLREIIRIIAGRFVGMVAIVVIVVAAALVASMYAPKWYRSEQKLQAGPPQEINPLEGAALFRDRVSLYINQLRSVISSDTVLAQALMKADGLDVSDAEKVKGYVLANTEKVQKLRENLRVLTPGGPDVTFTSNVTVQVDWAEDRAEARKLGENSCKLAARRAHELCKYVVESYKDRYLELENKRAEVARDFYKGKALKQAEDDLAKVSRAYDTFVTNVAKADLLQIRQMAAGSSGLETGKASLATRYAGDLTALAEDIARVATLRNQLKSELANKKEADELVVPDAVTKANPAITALQSEILKVKIKINQLSPRYTEDYQELRNTRYELEELSKELRKAVEMQVTRLDQEMAVLEARSKPINSSLSGDKSRLEELAGKVPQFQQLQADLQAAQTRYQEQKDKVLQAQEAGGDAKQAAPILFTVLDDASMPDYKKPRSPILWINILIAAVSGVILAFIYAFSADHFDHSLKSIDDAERYLGVPVLASVPKIRSGVVSTTAGGAK